MRNLIPQNFNDSLCLALVLLIAGMWVLSGLKVIILPAEVTGALIVTWTLLVQHYFRKKKSEATKG